MNKAEALEFLELPGSASDQDISTRLAEKLAYFELLSEKSPSAFLRRVHGQHVARIKLLQKESLLWPPDIAEIAEPAELPEPVIPTDAPVEKYETEPELQTEEQNEMVLQSGSGDQQQIPEVPELIVLSEPVISTDAPVEKYETEPELQTEEQNEMVLQSGSGDQQQIPEVPELIFLSEAVKEPEDMPVIEPEPQQESDPQTEEQNEMVLQSGSADHQQMPEVPELTVLQEAVKEPENMPAIKPESRQDSDPIPEISLQSVFSGDEEVISAPLPAVEEEEIIAVQTEMAKDPEIIQDVRPAEQSSIIIPDIQPESSKDESVSSRSETRLSAQEQETPATPEPTTFIPTAEWTGMQQRSRPAPEPVGWLVRHTENQSVKKFPVYPGKNFIGRKPQPGMKPFIQVEEDPFVSRVHAALYADGSGVYHFYISDSSSSNGGKASKNGTYVNGSEDRINAKVKLDDRDTIQIGVSKFVLRCKMTNLKKMVKEVEDSDFMHTVVIDPHGQ